MADRDTARDDALARLDALERHADSLEAAVAERLADLRAEIGSARDAVAELHAAAQVRPEPAADPAAAPAEDGARLVALDLVTRGTPRDEAVLRLAEAFPGVDVASVFDDASRGLDS